jgi:hypothetical protein
MKRITLFTIAIFITCPKVYSQIGYLGANFTLGASYQLENSQSAVALGYGINYEIIFPQRMRDKEKIGSFSLIATYDNILKRGYNNNFEILSLRRHEFGLGAGFDFLNYLNEDYPHTGFAGNTVLKYQFRDLKSPQVLTYCNMIGFSFKMNELYKGKFFMVSEIDLQKARIDNQEYQFAYWGFSFIIQRKLHQNSKIFFENWI